MDTGHFKWSGLMKILFLGPPDSPLIDFIKTCGDQIIQTMDVLDQGTVSAWGPEFMISYSYRHILKKNILDMFENKAINLHIAYLPWNRGADPNFWSFIDGTPKGVTIQFLDEGIDSGDIIAQKEVTFTKNETLKTSYEKLQLALQDLFKRHWVSIRNGDCPRKSPKVAGTFHLKKDKEPLLFLLKDGWDTPVCILEEHGQKPRNKNERT